jgi:hypothetical protein
MECGTCYVWSFAVTSFNRSEQAVFPIPSLQIRPRLNRRHFLRGSGAAMISLPLLEAMGRTVGQRALAGEHPVEVPPRRFVAACATLGFHTPFLFPDQSGELLQGSEPNEDSEPRSGSGAETFSTPYLSKLAEHRDQITPLSGLSHPDQQGNNGHASELTWLTSAQRPGLAGFRNTISIDQVIARQVGLQTRFPFLALSTSGRSMSWSSAGVEIPAESSPAKLFKALFVQGTPEEVDAEMQNVRRGRSILDTVGGAAKRLEGELGTADREKLEGYLTAVRDLESRLQESQNWVQRPKPQVEADPPQDINDKSDAIARQALMYDMIALALQTDSTRTITFQLGGLNAVPKIPGVASDWHGLSHHGKDPQKIDELRIIEEAEFEAFGKFLSKLRSIDEGAIDGERRSLLDQTTIVYGSNLGNASAHDWRNLPIIVAGGGFRHGRYTAHDPKSNTPLANLFVAIAQHLGVEMDRFGSSTADSVAGLEIG